MPYRLVCLCLALATLTGCAGLAGPGSGGPTVTLPAHPAWFDDKRVYYISTDAWPRQAAIATGTNHTPRLRHSLPPRPKPPELDTVIERVYVFVDGEQASIFPSAPEPIGPGSQNQPYSPLWQKYEVEWIEPDQRRELRSEGALFDAEAAGDVTITATDWVINCAVVADAEGNRLPGTELRGLGY